MKLAFTFIFLISTLTYSQVGIGTTTPEGAFDIVSPNMGMVLPRVSAIENVVQPNGSTAANGTVVYDISREKVCHRVQNTWICTGIDSNGNSQTQVTLTPPTVIATYIKASNTDIADNFGQSVALSADGNYLAIGTFFEDSVSGGINGNQSNNSATNSGAVYLFVKSGTTWIQQAYIKPFFPNVSDHFGEVVALSEDGSRLVVGAPLEDGGSIGVNGNQFDNSVQNAGAAFVYRRTGVNWIQEAYLKSFAVDIDDVFGNAVAISNDGSVIAVGARQEDSNAIGVDGDFTNNDTTTLDSGAVYTYTRSGTNWNTQSYFKAVDTQYSTIFGFKIALGGDGNLLVVSSPGERSDSTGINGDPYNNNALSSGAVYVFRNQGGWAQEAFIKASNTEASDFFGASVALSNDGNKLLVGAEGESSNATGLDGDQSNNGASTSGAAYLFSHDGNQWSQINYIKASNTRAGHRFGKTAELSGSGTRIIIGTTEENSGSTGINGNENNTSTFRAGAAYIFDKENGVWGQTAYVKSSNTEASDVFGHAIATTAIGDTVVISAPGEDSNATGINGDQANNGAQDSGAVYIIK
ncbi:MAG: FG-GAP repeat protein [Bacteroidetes bacterium]|nr:FG-GAP repeat protein [Bacteroidota bacterium]